MKIRTNLYFGLLSHACSLSKIKMRILDFSFQARFSYPFSRNINMHILCSSHIPHGKSKNKFENEDLFVFWWSFRSFSWPVCFITQWYCGLGLPKTSRVRENFSLIRIVSRKKKTSRRLFFGLFLFVTDLNGQQRLIMSCRKQKWKISVWNMKTFDITFYNTLMSIYYNWGLKPLFVNLLWCTNKSIFQVALD